MRGFFYHACPLCHRNVLLTQLISYHVLPLQPEYAELHSDGSWELMYDGAALKISPDLVLSGTEVYPTVGYRQRAFLIHQRCYELVGKPSSFQLYRLIDVVEPTRMRQMAPSASVNGAFSLPDSHCLPSKDSSLVHLVHRLPSDIWHKVLEYDIGRMLYVVKAASQLWVQECLSPSEVPEHRFSEQTVTIEGDAVRIHLVDIGGRIYISRLSEPPSKRQICGNFLTRILLMFVSTALFSWFFTEYVQQVTFRWLGRGRKARRSQPEKKPCRDYKLNGSTYLAVKRDEMGVIDIAFHPRPNSEPEWILGNSAHPFQVQTSVIQCANLHRIRLIRDASYTSILNPNATKGHTTDIANSH